MNRVDSRLTDRLTVALKKLGRAHTGIQVAQHGDGSIVALKHGGAMMTLEFGHHQVTSFSDSTIKKWANKIDAHLTKYARGDYHSQHERIEKFNRDADKREKEKEKENFIYSFERCRRARERQTVVFY